MAVAAEGAEDSGGIGEVIWNIVLLVRKDHTHRRDAAMSAGHDRRQATVGSVVGSETPPNIVLVGALQSRVVANGI